MKPRRTAKLTALVALIAGAIAGCGGDGGASGPEKGLAVLGSLPRAGHGLVLAKSPVVLPGHYPLGSVLHFRLPLENRSDRPARITTVDPGCLCVAAKPETRRIGPGEESWLNVIYYTKYDGPAAHFESIRVYSSLDAHPRRPSLADAKHTIWFKVRTASRS